MKDRIACCATIKNSMIPLLHAVIGDGTIPFAAYTTAGYKCFSLGWQPPKLPPMGEGDLNPI